MKIILPMVTCFLCFHQTVFGNQMTEFIAKNQEFSAEIYKALTTTEKNFIVSPASVQILLAIASSGAKGATFDELIRGLKMPNGSMRKVRTLIASFLNTLWEQEDNVLTIGNKLFFKEGFTINPTFGENALISFDAEFGDVNFNDGYKTVDVVNKWVARKTNNTIKNFYDVDSIDPLTVLLMVNTIYFHGKWENKFKRSGTSKLPFYVTPNSTIDLDTMTLTANFQYSVNKELDARFIQIPYENNESWMTIVLPNKLDGLDALEKQIEKVLEPQEYDYVSFDREINLHLPKFIHQSKLKLIPILKKMGINIPFTGYADFSNMGDKGSEKLPIWIGDITQQTYLKLNEDGTEAATATEMHIMMMSDPLPPIDFHVDHPFMFMLHYNDAILFIGRYLG